LKTREGTKRGVIELLWEEILPESKSILINLALPLLAATGLKLGCLLILKRGKGT